MLPSLFCSFSALNNCYVCTLSQDYAIDKSDCHVTRQFELRRQKRLNVILLVCKWDDNLAAEVLQKTVCASSWIALVSQTKPTPRWVDRYAFTAYTGTNNESHLGPRIETQLGIERRTSFLRAWTRPNFFLGATSFATRDSWFGGGLVPTFICVRYLYLSNNVAKAPPKFELNFSKIEDDNSPMNLTTKTTWKK